MSNLPKIAGNAKLVAMLLRGATGDLAQNQHGNFVYAADGKITENSSKPLIIITADYEMLLTPAGANFMLENLWHVASDAPGATHGAKLAFIKRLQDFGGRSSY